MWSSQPYLAGGTLILADRLNGLGCSLVASSLSPPVPKFSHDVLVTSKNSAPSVRESAELAGSPPCDSPSTFDACSIDSSSKTTSLLVNVVSVLGSQSLNLLT